jgi:DNA-binding Xre family transcriptional regulator
MLTLSLNIMALKHALEIKRGQLISNSEIARGAKIHYNTVNKLVRGDTIMLYFSTLTKLSNYFESEGLTIKISNLFCWQDNQLVSNIGPLFAELDPIPTDSEIAEVTGIPLLRLENLIRGNVKRVYLDDLARLLIFLEERGGSVEVGDLLRVEGSN